MDADFHAVLSYLGLEVCLDVSTEAEMIAQINQIPKSY